MQHDGAALRVLYIGGTGTISASCVRLSVASGMSVNGAEPRATTARLGRTPDGVTWLTGDVTDDRVPARRRSVTSASTRSSTSCPTTPTTCAGWWRPSPPAPTQYVHISSGSIYAKPVQQSPISESTPIAPTRCCEYATAKWRAELALQRALTEEGFPVTIVRPSHTYDDANPPLPGGWTVVDRIARGARDPGARRRHVAVDADPRRGLRPGPRRSARQPSDDRRGLQHHRRRRLHLGPDLRHRR